MSLDSAIKQLEIDLVGTEKAKFPSAAWYLRRANALALSSLRAMKEAGVEGDERSAEDFYRRRLNRFKAPETPEEKEI